MSPAAAIAGRSDCLSFGLTRFAGPHRAGTAPAADRWTKTPIVGAVSVAQAPLGGGQSLAHTDRRCRFATARDFPGFQLNRAPAGWIGVNPTARTGPGLKSGT